MSEFSVRTELLKNKNFAEKRPNQKMKLAEESVFKSPKAYVTVATF